MIDRVFYYRLSYLICLERISLYCLELLEFDIVKNKCYRKRLFHLAYCIIITNCQNIYDFLEQLVNTVNGLKS